MAELSVCIITKNEAEKLEQCLKSIKKHNEHCRKSHKDIDVEIVVVDTGSTDNTKAVIEQYADISAVFEWCDHFSKARNYAISLATCDKILVLDSDEVVEYMDCAAIGKMLSEKPYIVGRIELLNIYHDEDGAVQGTERLCRIFDRRYYEYQGRIHEQVVRKSINNENDTGVFVITQGNDKSVDKADGEIFYKNMPIRVRHTGYDGTPEEKRRKAGRNITLLQLDLEEYGPDPYTYYQLGKSYFMQQEYYEAGRYFEEGLGFDLDPKLEYVQDMVETYAYALLKQNRFAEMMFLRNIYNEFAVSADYVFLTGLAYMNNGHFEEAIAEFEKATSYKHCKVAGCNSYKAFYNAGVICECLGQKERATQYYNKCGSYEQAKQGLARIGVS